MSPPTKKYLFLSMGQGGLFSLLNPPFPGTTNRIGTHGCRTCVCVYIPISATDFFAAHTDGHASHPADPKADEGWIPTDQQGSSLKAFTRSTLVNALPRLANGEYAHSDLRKNAIVICPRRTVFLDGKGQKATGRYIVEAINQFFQLRGPTETAHGFVVDHKSLDMEYLKFGGVMFNSADQNHLDRYWQLQSMVRTSEVASEQLTLFSSCQEKSAMDYGYEAVESDQKREWSFMCDPKTRLWSILES